MDRRRQLGQRRRPRELQPGQTRRTNRPLQPDKVACGQTGGFNNHYRRVGRALARRLHSNHEVPIPESYFTLFGKGSVPDDHSSTHPSPDQILRVFNRVHQTVLENLQQVSEDQLDEPTDGTHPMFTNKRGCLRWLMQHEYSHAGQLGLLRRQLGHDPLW